MKVYSKGFTLIELIIAIVVLGILAAVAAPKFLNIQDDAYDAMIDGLGSQLETGVKFTQSQWLVNGALKDSQVNLDGYGGGSLDVNDLGFPLGQTKGQAMNNPYQIGSNDKGCWEIWDAILDVDFTITDVIGQADEHDFFTRRARIPVPEAGDNRLSVCYYAYTKKGFNKDQPYDSDFVFWYNSRTGTVSHNAPDNVIPR